MSAASISSSSISQGEWCWAGRGEFLGIIGDLAFGEGAGDLFTGLRGDGDLGDLLTTDTGDRQVDESLVEFIGPGDRTLLGDDFSLDLGPGDRTLRLPGVPGQSMTSPSSGLLTSLLGLSIGFSLRTLTSFLSVTTSHPSLLLLTLFGVGALNSLSSSLFSLSSEFDRSELSTISRFLSLQGGATDEDELPASTPLLWFTGLLPEEPLGPLALLLELEEDLLPELAETALLLDTVEEEALPFTSSAFGKRELSCRGPDTRFSSL